MTFVMVSPRVEVTIEGLCLNHIHTRYVEGVIEADEMERDIERALRGEYELPMGGMPPPFTTETSER